MRKLIEIRMVAEGAPIWTKPRDLSYCCFSASKTLDASSLRSGPSPRRSVFLFVTRGLFSVLFMDAINYWIESKYRATINSLLGFGFRLGFVVMAGLLDWFFWSSGFGLPYSFRHDDFDALPDVDAAPGLRTQRSICPRFAFITDPLITGVCAAKSRVRAISEGSIKRP